MARHARPRTHRKSRNSAIAVVTAGAAALTVSALRTPSHAAHTESTADAGSVRTVADTLAQPANAAATSMARQSTVALRRAHDQALDRRKQEQAKERAAAQAKAKAKAKQAADERRRREAAAQATARHREAARPAPARTAAPAASAAPAPTATPTPSATPSAATATAYPNTLDGWIRQALAVMAQHHIPGTYDGIYRNIMRESSGDPNAVNNWDSNAAAGTPSKGLLQVIQPTFDAYHVAGTSDDIMDPVANIVAACNYAAQLYGSIDNVNSAY